MVRLRNGRLINNIQVPKKWPKECSICFNALNRDNYIHLGCGHTFCPCLFVWFDRDLSCPLCREVTQTIEGRLAEPLHLTSKSLKKHKRDMEKLTFFFTAACLLSHAIMLNTKNRQDTINYFNIILVFCLSFCLGSINRLWSIY